MTQGACKRCADKKQYRGIDGCLRYCEVCARHHDMHDIKDKETTQGSKAQEIDIHSAEFKKTQAYKDAIQKIMLDANCSRKTAQNLYNHQYN